MTQKYQVNSRISNKISTFALKINNRHEIFIKSR